MTALLEPPTRFIGLDVHESSVVISTIDAQQHVILPAHRLNLGEFELWRQQRLQPTAAVVLGAITNAWHPYDQLSARAGSVTMANPSPGRPGSGLAGEMVARASQSGDHHPRPLE